MVHEDSVQSNIKQYYEKNKGDESPSISKGSTGNGSLVNGKLMPYSGANFRYFDNSSYLLGRAFINHRVRNTVLDGYKLLEVSAKDRRFYIMECSHKKGGTLFPHRTHQNGLSVDFMIPKLRKDSPYYGLDSMGTRHYFLMFDNKGRYSVDSNIVLDLNTTALHIIELDKAAKKNGLKIKKVILKTELIPLLFATPNGKKLKSRHIYFAKYLTPFINDSHDEHFHIDFEAVAKVK